MTGRGNGSGVLEVTDSGAVRTLALNRPERCNALDGELLVGNGDLAAFS